MDRSVNNINTMKNLKHGFVQKILRFEVNYSHRQLSTLQYELYKNYRNINSVLPIDICDSFFRYQENKFAKNWHEENVRIIKKIERLKRITTYDKCKHIKNIKYTLTMTEPKIEGTEFRPSTIKKISTNEGNINYSIDKDVRRFRTFAGGGSVEWGSGNSMGTNIGTSFTGLGSIGKVSTYDSNKVHHINVTPDKFSLCFNYKIDNVNDDWLINLTDINIPNYAKYILQLGPRFNLPDFVTNNKKMTVEFIKHIENNIVKLDEKTKNLIRKDTITVLNSINYKLPNNKFDNIIKQGIWELKMFLNNNQGLLVTKADKGNATVILSHDEYVKKMSDILSDI